VVAAGAGKWAVPTTIWGFSDGQSLFVRHEENFFPLQRQGRFFTTVGNASPNTQSTRVAKTDSEWSRSLLVPVATTLDVPVGYAVDMRSGQLERYPGLRAPTRPDTAYVYVYRPARAAGPPRVQVWLNGRQAGALRPGEYLELPWPYFATLFNLCLATDGGGSACQYLMPDVTRPNFLRVTLSPESPLWQWVPAAQGLADLDELDKHQKTNR
jgi:hypothetical protein